MLALEYAGHLQHIKPQERNTLMIQQISVRQAPREVLSRCSYFKSHREQTELVARGAPYAPVLASSKLIVSERR